MENDPRPLELRTDSQYVHDGIRRWNAWRRSGWPGANGDLWGRVHSCLIRDPGRVVTTKVKGHATWDDVSRGRVRLEDKIGNSHADRLAGAGADLHEALIALETEAQARIEGAKAQQRKMLKILMERESLLSQLPAHVVDPPFGQFTRNVRRRL